MGLGSFTIAPPPTREVQRKDAIALVVKAALLQIPLKYLHSPLDWVG